MAYPHRRGSCCSATARASRRRPSTRALVSTVPASRHTSAASYECRVQQTTFCPPRVACECIGAHHRQLCVLRWAQIESDGRRIGSGASSTTATKTGVVPRRRIRPRLHHRRRLRTTATVVTTPIPVAWRAANVAALPCATTTDRPVRPSLPRSTTHGDLCRHVDKTSSERW